MGEWNVNVTPFFISQALILIAFVFDLVSFQLRHRKQILACFVASTVFIATHFFILNLIPAGLLVLVSTARFSVAYFSKAPGWMWVFVSISCGVLFFTYQSPVNLLSFLASVIAAAASFESNDQRLRLGMMAVTTTWLIHNALSGTPAAVLLEAFFLVSNGVGYWRFYGANRRPLFKQNPN